MQIARTCLLSVVAIASLSQRPTVVAWNCSGENLENTVVYEGSTTTTFPRFNSGQWQVIPASSFYNEIMDITDSDGDDDLNVEFSSTYALSQSDLEILNSTLAPQERMPQSTAGLYFLKQLNPNCSMAANLIVIRSGPVCDRNATNPNNVTLSCSLVYGESPAQPNYPVFTWKKSDGVQVKQDQPIPRLIERYIRRSISQLSISSNDITKYECQMTFSRPPKAPFAYINLKPPSFNASCSVPTTIVAYNCSNVNLANTVVYKGDTATFPKLNNGQWQVVPASSDFNHILNITDINDYMHTDFRDIYAVSGSQLRIINSTTYPQGSMPYTTAGLYVLKDLNPNCTKAANLIVIGWGPACGYNAMNPNNVTYSCTVIYAESSVQPNDPVFTWIRRDGVQVKQDQPIPSLTERYIRESMSELSLASNDSARYKCQVTFSTAVRSSSITYINTDAPSFTASCAVFDGF